MAKFRGLSKTQGHMTGGKITRGKTGVLLVNLGTPDEPTTPALRRYLAEFLSDPRVIEVPKVIWQCILHGIILRTRPAKSAEAYREVWTESGSPLLDISLKQTAALSEKLAELEQAVPVYLGMRYGNPAVGQVMQQMQQDGIDNFIILPLYPQSAAPTTASVFDAVAKELMTWRYVPSVHFIHTYHDHPDYIQAMSDSIRRDFAEHGQPQKLILSYHGMPQKYLEAGDPYYCFCLKTSRLIAENLGLTEAQYLTTFQSRFGKEVWLQPYTDETIKALPAQGIKDIAIISPAFSADCLETLEELDGENREYFEQAGGESFRYIPCLNDHPQHIEMMYQLIKPYLPSAQSA